MRSGEVQNGPVFEKFNRFSIIGVRRFFSRSVGTQTIANTSATDTCLPTILAVFRNSFVSRRVVFDNLAALLSLDGYIARILWIRRARKIESSIFADVLENILVSGASGVSFGVEISDTYLFTVDYATCSPAFVASLIILNDVSILRRRACWSRGIPSTFAALLSAFNCLRISKILKQFLFFFFGGILPTIFLAFREAYACFFAFRNTTISFAYFLTNCLWHDASFNAFSAIGNICKKWVPRSQISDTCDPSFFFNRPVVTIINLVNNLQFRFKPKSKKTFYPMVFMCISLQGRLAEMLIESRFGPDGFAYVAHRLVPWVHESIYECATMFLRLSRLLQQAAHGLASIVRGLAALSSYDYNMLEGA